MIELQTKQKTNIHHTQSKKTMIRLNNIEKVYRTDTVETLALNSISLDIAAGEFLSIMGPSGCGKSTLLNIMGLLDAPTKGEVKIAEEKTENLNDKELAHFRNKKLGFIFQSYHLINDLKVIDNVELPLLYRNVTAKERRQLAEEALGKVGLSNRMKHFPTQLSGGQKQRVAIARAIVGQPEIILADEPTGNLDSAMGNEIMEILIQLNRTERTTIVMVTHDEHMAKQTHRLVRLFDGKQVA
jgi:putative ABC transport system ATP-binding protein